jgi:hypothetical protein
MIAGKGDHHQGKTHYLSDHAIGPASANDRQKGETTGGNSLAVGSGRRAGISKQ